MSEPKDNPKLRELKRKWDEGYFGLDSVSVYSVEEVMREASKHLLPNPWADGKTPAEEDDVGDWKPKPPEGIFGWKGIESPQRSNNEISRELGRRREADRRYADNSDDYMDRKFGHKICCVCNKRTRNNPCDSCYRMVRDAAEWTNEQCIMEIGPCMMCDVEVYSTICGPCMDVMLSGEGD